MPSLAQGYGRGLLLGLQLEEAKRQRKSQELLDEYRQEQLQDIRWGREKEKKSFLAQIKAEEEAAKRQEMIADIAAIEAGGLRTGEQFMRSILGGEETPPETKKRLTSIMDYVPGLSSEEQFKRRRVEEKVEGAPGVRPWYETYLGGEEMRGAAEVAGGLKPKAEKPKLSTEWLKIPEKEKSAIQKWGTDWEKHIFDKTAAAGSEELFFLNKEELESYKKATEKRSKSPVSQLSTEIEQAEIIGIAKRRYFNKWIKRVPADLRMEVKQQAGMISSTAVEVPEEPGPSGESEDEFIRQAQSQGQGVDDINWEAVVKKYPNLDIEYIKSKL